MSMVEKRFSLMCSPSLLFVGLLAVSNIIIVAQVQFKITVYKLFSVDIWSQNLFEILRKTSEMSLG